MELSLHFVILFYVDCRKLNASEDDSEKNRDQQ